MAQVKTSRDWISRSGPAGRRYTTVIFTLKRAAVVRFSVMRIAPDCRHIGSVVLRGHQGMNRVRFRGRVAGRALPPGTYELRSSGVRTRIVIFKRTPLPEEVAAARASNTCGSSAGISGFDAHGAAQSATLGGAGGHAKGSGRGNQGTTKASSTNDRSERFGVLGVRFTRAAEAVKEIPRPLFAILGLAILLLALAALPLRWVPNARVAAVLAYRRSLVALAGAITLVAVAVAYALA